jgi:hypothetical protein
MTPTQGLVLAAAATALLFLVAGMSLVVRALEARGRHAPRFEPRRHLALLVEDRSDDDDTADLTAYVCPYCHRDAGHNDDCPRLGRLRLAAQQIEIPREGEMQ